VALSGGDRLVGPLGSAAYLGAAMALLVPIAVGVAADTSWLVRQRWVAGGCAGLGLVALVGSGARAAWLGAGVALLAVGWARRAWFRARLGVTLVAVICGGGLLIGLAFTTGVAGRVPAAVQSGQPGGLSRVAEWRVATRVLVAHPVLGVGPEGYRVVFGSAVDASYQRQFGRNPLPDRAHDSLLDVAVTVGIPGAAAYLALLVVVGRLVGRALRSSPWLVGVASGLAAYTVGALLLFPVSELEPGVWLLAGLVATQVATESELVSVRAPRLAQVALAGVAGLALVLGVRAVAADRAIRTALSLGRSQPAGVRDAQRAVGLAPSDIVVRLVAAEIDASTGSVAGIDRGLAQVRAALRVSPRDPVLGDEEGHLLVARAQTTNAATDWRAAAQNLSGVAARDPRNPAVLLELGVAEASLGERAGAVRAWTLASALDPASPAPQTDLALMYDQAGQSNAARNAAQAALGRDPTDALAAAVLARLDGRHGT
jgi:hypothetical protein